MAVVCAAFGLALVGVGVFVLDLKFDPETAGGLSESRIDADYTDCAD